VSSGKQKVTLRGREEDNIFKTKWKIDVYEDSIICLRQKAQVSTV
jgi:hypothetical protein